MKTFIEQVDDGRPIEDLNDFISEFSLGNHSFPGLGYALGLTHDEYVSWGRILFNDGSSVAIPLLQDLFDLKKEKATDNVASDNRPTIHGSR